MRIWLFAVVGILLTPPVLADGSTYSRYGIGDIMYGSSESRIGAAGVDMTNLSPISINSLNPAGLTGLKYVRFAGAFSYNSIVSKDASQSARFSNGSFNGMNIAVPIWSEYALALGAGISPYSVVNYKVKTPFTRFGTQYDVNYIGGGGLTRASFNVAARPLNGLSLGVGYGFLLGNIRTEFQTQSSDVNFFNSDVVQSTEARGSLFTVGLIYTGLGSLTGIKAVEPLSIGGVFSTPASLSTTTRYVYDYITGRDTTAGIKGSMDIPGAYGIGLSYLIDNRVTIAAEMYAQQWQKMKINGLTPEEIRNSLRYALGAEYAPVIDPNSTYLERVIVRAGAAYNQTYYSIQDEPINEIQFTAGLGLPVVYDTHLDLSFSYSIRGTTKQTPGQANALPIQLVQDHIFRIDLGLSIGELWFVKSSDE